MGKITKTKLEFKRRMTNKQEGVFISRILRFSKKGIQISRTPDGKGKFWVDLENYYNQNEIDLAEEFNIDDPVKMVLRVDTYINKENEITTKASLVEISRFEESEMKYWTHNQPKGAIKAEVEKAIKTTIPGLFVLEVTRVDGDNKPQESYHIRYYSKNGEAPELGRYEIDFDLYTSSRIIQSDGEIFTKTEFYDVAGESKTNTVYAPYLEANHIYQLVSSKHD